MRFWNWRNGSAVRAPDRGLPVTPRQDAGKGACCIHREVIPLLPLLVETQQAVFLGLCISPYANSTSEKAKKNFKILARHAQLKKKTVPKTAKQNKNGVNTCAQSKWDTEVIFFQSFELELQF